MRNFIFILIYLFTTKQKIIYSLGNAKFFIFGRIIWKNWTLESDMKIEKDFKLKFGMYNEIQ